MIKTTMHFSMDVDGPEPLSKFVFRITPRGGANRPYAVALADSFKRCEVLRPHLAKCEARTSSVVLWVRPSIAATRAVLAWMRETREAAGQQGVPFALAAAG